ncbi:anti-sigma factor [Subtercola sp. Z020]|uniref:anti-sigma factor n=1 Tax=Subtercola sp. Z020 TaxID=2080582 RepID=UPI000CE76BF5|nr:anti-sigma factor [Subtercola sp. Z020]PPF80023.1 anti-sigma factor [Subtercola sp. Z020]
MHTDPEILALIALGEPAGSEADGEHLAACRDCRATLDALTGAAVAGRSSASAPTLVAPHDRVWAQVAATVAAERAAATGDAGGGAGGGVGVGVGRVAVMGGDSPPQAAQSSPLPTRPRSRRVPARWLALAAAVVVVATAGGVATTLALRPSTPTATPSVTVLARAALSALPDWPDATGDAVVETDGSATSMVVSVNAATDRPDTYREVWLLSSDLTKLVSLGLLVGDSGTFAIPADIDMTEYAIVDVSSEPLDGNPAHSSNSILRGRLDA